MDEPTEESSPRGESDEHDGATLGPEAWRILDASYNRAGEGLRVVEDYVRFVLEDGHLTRQLKVLRHDLAATGRALPRAMRHACRDVQQDVGTAISTRSEAKRTDGFSVCVASLERTKQSLRSLEEYGKVVDATIAARFEAIRYRLYLLESAIGRTAEAIDRLRTTRLYVLVDGGESIEGFSAIVRQLVSAGVDAIQLRDKRLSDAELAIRARTLCRLTRECDRSEETAAASVAGEVSVGRAACLALINDRPDVAAAVGADGVHLGQDDLGVKDARSIVGPRRLIGVSTHTIAQARGAVLDGADYLGVGPAFPSLTKDFPEYPGLEFVQQVASEICLPAFAIGGVSADNLSAVVGAGASRVAVGAALTRANDPYAAAVGIRRLLDEGAHGGARR